MASPFSSFLRGGSKPVLRSHDLQTQWRQFVYGIDWIPSASDILNITMKHSSSVTVRPSRHLSGSLRLPGDKSISHRYAMLGAIAEGRSRFENYSTGADCASTLACLRDLGVQLSRTGEHANSIEIEGRGRFLSAPRAPLDCGNSGSTMRMLSGILAGQEFESELTGDESLSRRPMSRSIKPLGTIGSKIRHLDANR